MAKLHKVEMFITDVNESYDELEVLLAHIEDRFDVSIEVSDSKSVEIEWDDDIDINKVSATKEDFEKYFK